MNVDGARVRLLQDRVLILPDELPKQTSGGLYIPESVREDQLADQRVAKRGRIIAMGEGLRRKDGKRFAMPDVKPGDVVYYAGHFGVVTIDGVKHVATRGDQIEAVDETKEAAS